MSRYSRTPDPQASRTGFSHLDASGQARRVDVGSKPRQSRRAVAEGRLMCQPATIRALRAKALPKGAVLAVAQIAGIQAAKPLEYRRTTPIPPLHKS